MYKISILFRNAKVRTFKYRPLSQSEISRISQISCGLFELANNRTDRCTACTIYSCNSRNSWRKKTLLTDGLSQPQIPWILLLC